MELRNELGQVKCPEVLGRKNCFFDYLTPEEEHAIREWRWGAANRLRAALGGTPWYANRAAKCKEETGSEMAYWLDLQSSSIRMERPDPPDNYVPEDLTEQQKAELLDDAMCVISKHRQPPGVPAINMRPTHPNE